jgi:hypothetical protein
MLKLTSLADQCPRSGWSKPRIVETSDTFCFIPYPKKKRIDQKKKLGYVYVVDGIVTANGEVGISGSRSSPFENKTFLQAKQGGPKDSTRFHPEHVVNNFKLQFQIPSRALPSTRVMYTHSG